MMPRMAMGMDMGARGAGERGVNMGVVGGMEKRRVDLDMGMGMGMKAGAVNMETEGGMGMEAGNTAARRRTMETRDTGTDEDGVELK